MIKVPNAWRRDEEVQLKRWGLDSHELGGSVPGCRSSYTRPGQDDAQLYNGE